RRERALDLAAGTDAVAISPDGRTLVAIESPRRGRKTTLQVIDPVKLTTRNHHLALSSYDVAVRDDGLVLLSGGEGDWSAVGLVDARGGRLLPTWAGVWGKSLLGLTPDGRRLYVSSQGVVPGTLNAYALPASARAASTEEPPAAQRPLEYDKLSLGGGF